MSGRSIKEAQDTATALRLLAAQARLYTDSKRVYDLRLGIVFAVALGTVVAALSLPSARTLIGGIGGTALLLVSVVGSDREKRRRKEAVAVQEEFDTLVFDLPWNNLVVDRPSPTLISESAARYRGNRIKNWYPDVSTVIRPLDILICQRTNLGWGSAVHRLWAAVVSGALVFLVLAATLMWILLDLTPTDALAILIFPLAGPARELVEMVKANRDNADTKRQAESKVLALWERGMAAAGQVTEHDCRTVQDKIVAIRLTNAGVPDWFDGLRRARSEAIMQDSARHLIEEAERNDKTLD